jgi:hypothetical protein
VIGNRRNCTLRRFIVYTGNLTLPTQKEAAEVYSSAGANMKRMQVLVGNLYLKRGTGIHRR